MKFSDVSARIGKDVFITNSTGWQSPVFRAAIQPLRYKTRCISAEFTPKSGRQNMITFIYRPA